MRITHAKTPACASCGGHRWSRRATSLVTREWICAPDGEFEFENEEEDDNGDAEWACADCDEAPGSAALEALELL